MITRFFFFFFFSFFFFFFFFVTAVGLKVGKGSLRCSFVQKSLFYFRIKFYTPVNKIL